MTHITYLIGQTVEARKRLLDKEMTLKNIHTMNYLHIVPSRSMVMDIERQGSGSLNRPTDTLTSLIGRIFSNEILYQSFKNFSFMDDTVQELAVQLILEKRNGMPEGLKYFFPLFGPHARNVSLPGIYHHILGFFSLLVNNNFEDSFVDELARKIIQLDEKRPGAGEERYALDTDLALLFGDYEEFKRTNHLYDNDDIVSSVRSFLAKGSPPRLLNDINVIIFDGFISITKAEEEILLNLFKNVDEVIWPLDFDPHVDDPIKSLKEVSGHERYGGLDGYEAFRIFAPHVSLIKKIESAGFPAHIKKAPPEEFKNPFASGLYRSGRDNHSTQKALKIKSFNTRLDEIKGIAGEIKKISIQKKMKDLNEIRIIFPDLDEYSSLIYGMFPEYGIPFNITKGLPLSSSPLTALFILLIDIPLNGYGRNEISKFFTSSLVSPIMVRVGKGGKAQWLRFLQSEEAFFSGGKEVNIDRFFKSQSEDKEGYRFGIEAIDKVARQCGIQAGDIVTGWLPRARDYFFSLYRSSSDQGRRTEILAEYYLFLHQLFYLKENVKPFGDLLSQQNPHKIVQNLFYLLDIFGIQKNILSLLKDEIGLHQKVAERIIKRDVRTLYTLKDLAIKAAKELEKVELYTDIRSRAPLLERFRRRFIDLVNRYRIREYYQRGAVGISEWDDIIGCSCDYIFAGGLTADEFPLKEPYDFIVPDSSERYLRKIDLADQSRYLFSSTLCNYRQGLYLSYPKRIQDKEVQPTPVLLDMVSIIDDHSQSPFLGIDVLESSFPWNENPYFTSSEEFLNSLEVEKKLSIPSKVGQFTHEHIILGTDTDLNESVVRGVHCLIARNSVEGLSEYDGLVFNSHNFPHLLSRFKDTFSTSRLDMLANCPLRYLFQEILCLEPVEELEEELSVKDIGSHVHAILKILFDELKKHGENVSSIGLSRAFALAREIGNQYFALLTHLEGLDFFETQKRDIMDGLDTESLMSENGLPKREGLLAQLLRFEEQNLHGQDVIALEWRFGYEATNPVYIGQTPIRGYIDRVDRLAGEDDVFLIYDYKTGRAPALNEIKKGLSFQMPGYIWAIIGGRYSKAITARYYLINRRSLSEGSPFTSPICYHHVQKTGIDLSGVTLIGDYADKLMSLLKRGVFHHSTDELTCSYCEFKYACYKDTRRMACLVDSGAFPEVYSGRRNLEKWREVENFQKEWKEIQQKMAEPLNAKKEEKRRENLQQVVKFKEWLLTNRYSLSFDQEYIEKIIGEIEMYQKSFSLKQ